ncbi:hypothetical protein SAMN05428969_2057 [Devosia sp. YR412]|uniref:CPBP family intramembrane glutamic endopeptidase n=1 Tax=Devosia sp. YR412 TaxID=1881030 RepID=UPI0008D6425D|nr:CPBP family intramembrane glutamic endopeptidase [Devosia sp. YR412]SEQ11884.1 hypothetical protein SAMN05428969_2057 [Devosia sp. YR412]
MQGPDLPYYNGQPVAMTPAGWLTVLASTALAFALLVTLPFTTFPLNLLPAIGYTALPLLTLFAVTHGLPIALFRRVGLREIAMAFGFGILTIAASFAVGALLLRFISMASNPEAGLLGNLGLVGTLVFLLRTMIQLIGEEVMTVLPLLAVLWFCVERVGLSRRTGLVIAVLVSTALFAAAHLPTYQWNFVQCFAGIGTARLVLTAAFLISRNLWVSAGAHVVNDWTEFFLPTILLGHTPI